MRGIHYVIIIQPMDSKYSTHAARQSSTYVDQISRQEMSLLRAIDNTPNKAQFLTRSPSLTVLKNGILALWFSSWLDWLFFRSATAWSRLCTGGLVLVLGWLGVWQIGRIPSARPQLSSSGRASKEGVSGKSTQSEKTDTRHSQQEQSARRDLVEREEH